MRVSRILSGGIRQGNFSNHHIKGIAKIEMNAWETVWYRVSNFKLKCIHFVVCNITVPMFLFRKISLP